MTETNELLVRLNLFYDALHEMLDAIADNHSSSFCAQNSLNTN